jgi:electron transfer flavoprotein beta subunit
MEVLVCVKRVPATGGRITLTDDQRSIDAKFLGFTVSPHEECAVEESVRLVEANGGSSTVLTLGSDVSTEQLRDAVAMGADRAILLETDGEEWDPAATASAIADVVRAEREAGRGFDVLLFGNEAADTGGYQVGIRVAYALGLPCVTGVKRLEVSDGTATARRESASGGWEIFEVGLPAVFTVKEGINLPRYPSVPGRMRAKKKEIERVAPTPIAAGLERVRLKLPPEQGGEAEILGDGADAAAAVVDLLQRLGMVDR